MIYINKIIQYLLAIPILMIIRLIRSWFLVRFESLASLRIGHFAANTEMYLSERQACINIPEKKYIDIFYITEPVSNKQLARMWKRELHIWPAWIIKPISDLNKILPGGDCHLVKHNSYSNGLDVNNLIDRFPSHLKFTSEEEIRGKAEMKKMGMPIDAKFVCLNVRDNAYLDEKFPNYDWSYHNYRDSDIQNYVFAAESLAEHGYFVIRMGAKVNNALNSANPKLIDYATNGMRSDFMDIYLGAKCAFCITTGAGWDSIPEMFRRPIVYVNMLPIGCLHTFSSKFISITKLHVWKTTRKALTLSEIFSHGLGYCMSTSDYESKDVQLIDNSPEEIYDVVMEMVQRLENTWCEDQTHEMVQKKFWEIYQILTFKSTNNSFHGELRSRIGTEFLNQNINYLN